MWSLTDWSSIGFIPCQMFTDRRENYNQEWSCACVMCATTPTDQTSPQQFFKALNVFKSLKKFNNITLYKNLKKTIFYIFLRFIRLKASFFFFFVWYRFSLHNSLAEPNNSQVQVLALHKWLPSYISLWWILDKLPICALKCHTNVLIGLPRDV